MIGCALGYPVVLLLGPVRLDERDLLGIEQVFHQRILFHWLREADGIGASVHAEERTRFASLRNPCLQHLRVDHAWLTRRVTDSRHCMPSTHARITASIWHS